MQLELEPSAIDRFELKMGEYGPWMHDYRLGESIITGYFKYEGIGEQLTFVNSRSPAADIARMREAYERRRHDVWSGFVASLFDRVAPSGADRAAMHLL